MKAKCKPDSGGQMVMEFQRGADIMVPPNSRGRAHSVKPISKKVEADSSSGLRPERIHPENPLAVAMLVPLTSLTGWAVIALCRRKGGGAVVLTSETAQRTHPKKVAAECIPDREVALLYKVLGEGIVHMPPARKFVRNQTVGDSLSRWSVCTRSSGRNRWRERSRSFQPSCEVL